MTADPAPAPAGLRARLDRTLDTIGLRGPTARDALLATVATLASLAVLVPLLGPLAPTLGLELSGAQRVAIASVVAVQGALLVVRRRAPLACLGLVAVTQVVIATMLPADATLRAAAPFVAAYTAGTLLRPRALVAVVLGAVAVEVAGSWAAGATIGPVLLRLLGADPPGAVDPLVRIAGAAAVLLATVAAAAIGAWVAARREQLQAARARADAAVERQRERADAAIAAERVRMARELHDVAAHHLSGLVVQASAAERLVDRDPEAAKEVVRSLRRQGREALDNLRVAVGVLRDTSAEADAASAPVPGLAALDDLLASARAAGEDVELRVLGRPMPLPPLADTAAYRVAQEAVANARRHAPGAPIRLVLDHRGRDVRLEVVNAPAQPRPAVAEGGGFGLVGMRERAALLGASLETGETPDGGWRVVLVVPRGPGER